MAIGLQNETHQKDDFDKFLDTLNQPREVMASPALPEEETEPEPEMDLEEAEPEIDPVLEQKKLQVAMIPAQTVVDCIDCGFTSVNSMIAMEDQEGATDEEKESLKNATANWLRETNIDLSPGKMLLFLVLMIYGPKTVAAFQTRKENKEISRLQAEQAKMQKKIEEMQAQAERIEKLKKQAENIERQDAAHKTAQPKENEIPNK